MILVKVHEYLVMTLDFSVKGKVKVRMNDYVEKMIHNFLQKLKSTDMVITPAGNNIFDNDNGKLLGKSQAEAFHTMVAKDLFLSNIARPDIHPMIDVLATRVISPNIIDWEIDEGIEILQWIKEVSFGVES